MPESGRVPLKSLWCKSGLGPVPPGEVAAGAIRFTTSATSPRTHAFLPPGSSVNWLTAAPAVCVRQKAGEAGCAGRGGMTQHQNSTENERTFRVVSVSFQNPGLLCRLVAVQSLYCFWRVQSARPGPPAAEGRAQVVPGHCARSRRAGPSPDGHRGNTSRPAPGRMAAGVLYSAMQCGARLKGPTPGSTCTRRQASWQPACL
jgi:hypothetical protein